MVFNGGVCNNSYIIHLHRISGEKKKYDEELRERNEEGKKTKGKKSVWLDLNSSVLVVGKLPRSSIYSMRGQGCNNRGGIQGIIAWQWTNQIPSVVLQGIVCRLAQVHCIYHNGL